MWLGRCPILLKNEMLHIFLYLKRKWYFCWNTWLSWTFTQAFSFLELVVLFYNTLRCKYFKYILLSIKFTLNSDYWLTSCIERSHKILILIRPLSKQQKQLNDNSVPAYCEKELLQAKYLTVSLQCHIYNFLFIIIKYIKVCNRMILSW